MARELRDLKDNELVALRDGNYSGIDLRSLSDNAIRVLKARRDKKQVTPPVNSQVPEYLRQREPMSFGEMLTPVSREEVSLKRIPSTLPQDPTRVQLNPLADKSDSPFPTSGASLGVAMDKLGLPSSTTTVPRFVRGLKSSIGLNPDMPQAVRGEQEGTIDYPYESGAYRAGNIIGTGLSYVPALKALGWGMKALKIGTPLVRSIVRVAGAGAAGVGVEGTRQAISHQTTDEPFDVKRMLESGAWMAGGEAAILGVIGTYGKIKGVVALRKLNRELLAANEAEKRVLLKEVQDHIVSSGEKVNFGLGGFTELNKQETMSLARAIETARESGVVSEDLLANIQKADKKDLSDILTFLTKKRNNLPVDGVSQVVEPRPILKEAYKGEVASNPAPPVSPQGGMTARSSTGALLGFERDEDGNVTYNPTKGLMGAAAGIVVGGGLKGATTATKQFGALGRAGANLTKGLVSRALTLPIHRLSKFATTPYTQEIATTFAGINQRIQSGIGTTQAWFDDGLNTLGGVANPAHWKNFSYIRKYGKDYMEGRIVTEPPTKEAKVFLDGMKEQFGKIAGLVKSVNPDFETRMLYFPHWLTDQGRKALEVGSGSVYEAIKEMAGNVGVDVGFFMQRDFSKFMTKRFGSIDFKRLAKLPDHVMVNGKRIQILESDPFKMFPEYVDAAYRRAEVMRIFGADDVRAAGKANEIAQALYKTEGPDAARAFEDMWRGMNGFPVVDPAIYHNPLYRGWNATTAGIRVALLSASAVFNPLQIGFHTSRAGGMNTVRGVIDAFRPSVRGELRQSGVYAQSIMDDVYHMKELGGVTGKLSSLAFKLEGHTALNKLNNIVMARASEYNLIDAIERIRTGDKGNLRKLWGLDETGLRRQLEFQHQFSQVDIDRMVKNGIAPADIDRVRQQGAMLSNLSRENSTVKHRWLSRPLVREVLALTQFTRGVANAGAYAVREAGNGNVKPLVMFAGATELSYEATNAIRGLLFDRANEDNKLWEKIYGRLVRTGVIGLVSVVADKVRAVAEFGEEPLSLQMPMAEVMVNFARTAGSKGVDGAVMQAIPVYRLLWSAQGRATTDVQYYADRIEGRLYLGSGLSQKGQPYNMFSPKPGEGDQTVMKMLADAKTNGIETQVKIELLKRHYRKIIESKKEKYGAFLDYIDELENMDSDDTPGDR
jgi:hypothetical protein